VALGFELRKTLYHLSHAASLFCFSYISEKVLLFFFSFSSAKTMILLISTSPVAEMTGVSHPLGLLVEKGSHYLFAQDGWATVTLPIPAS
jgi:hypothetical protein